MRRRKQRNPLLMRILIVSVVAHLIALPILAKFGAFKKIQKQFVEVSTVRMAPPPPQDKPEVKKEAKVKPPKPAQTAKKAASTTAHQQRSAAHTNLNQPKVAVAAGDAVGDTGGSVEQGSGKAGEIPTQKADTTKPTVKETEPKPETKPEIKSEAPKTEIAAAKPEPIKPAPELTPVPESKHDPVFTEVAQTFAPQPTIPDSLRSEALDKTVVVDITVGADGLPLDVKLGESTGSDDLDRIAIETAHKWKFKPATRDGQPIESRVRLHIEFQVN